MGFQAVFAEDRPNLSPHLCIFLLPGKAASLLGECLISKQMSSLNEHRAIRILPVPRGLPMAQERQISLPSCGRSWLGRTAASPGLSSSWADLGLFIHQLFPYSFQEQHTLGLEEIISRSEKLPSPSPALASVYANVLPACTFRARGMY